jgi:hypothetical protein
MILPYKKSLCIGAMIAGKRLCCGYRDTHKKGGAIVPAEEILMCFPGSNQGYTACTGISRFSFARYDIALQVLVIYRI